MEEKWLLFLTLITYHLVVIRRQGSEQERTCRRWKSEKWKHPWASNDIIELVHCTFLGGTAWVTQVVFCFALVCSPVHHVICTPCKVLNMVQYFRMAFFSYRWKHLESKIKVKKVIKWLRTPWTLFSVFALWSYLGNSPISKLSYAFKPR